MSMLTDSMVFFEAFEAFEAFKAFAAFEAFFNHITATIYGEIFTVYIL